MSENQRTFDPLENYSITLDKMSQEFEERWSKLSPSPYTNLEGYVPRSVIGCGTFGTVLLVREKNGTEHYAAKMMYKEELVRLKQVKHVHNEKNVLAAVRFPFLVHLVDCTKDFDCLYLMLPYVNGGELFNYHRKVRKFSEKHALFYGAQIFLALEYMHRMNLMYRDLKPENILLDALGYIKLTDFGFTKRATDRTLTMCGTPEYLAPEIIQLKAYNKSVDWWAFGILLYEFVAGRSPFSAYNRDVLRMYSMICLGDYSIPNSFTSNLCNLVQGLVTVDAVRRLGNLVGGAQDIKCHAWFQGVDWFAILNQQVSAPYIPAVLDLDDPTIFKPIAHRNHVKSKVDRHAELFHDF